jgi:hypothetical protein
MRIHKFEWNDFFTGNPTTIVSSTQYNSRQTPSGTNVYVSNCLFSSFSSGSSGGALYCTSTYLLVELSSFFSCETSNSNGGAIYFTNTGSGECVLYGVCGHDCCSTYTSTSNGQFARIDVCDSASNKNYVNYSSITRCVNERSNSRFMLYLSGGKILCPSVNVSMNKCQYYTVYYYPFGDTSSVICSSSYSSYTDNNAFGHICFGFERTAKYEIKCCNILRNIQGNLNSCGTFYAPGNWEIKDSCILENNANRVFHVWSSTTLSLSNCTVDKTTNNGYLTIISTVTKSFILGLNHVSTRNCHSQYDSAEYLTAVPYVSDPTKKIFCYTCRICNCQARISDFFSLNWVFIVTFIHTI